MKANAFYMKVTMYKNSSFIIFALYTRGEKWLKFQFMSSDKGV